MVKKILSEEEIELNKKFKEEQIEIIEEGISRGLAKFLSHLTIAAFIIVIIFLGGFFAWSYYLSDNLPNNQQTAAMIPSKCNYEMIYCTIEDQTKLITSDCQCKEPNCACAEYYPKINAKNLCGYQEANAWFEQIKQSTDFKKFENLSMRCY